MSRGVAVTTMPSKPDELSPCWARQRTKITCGTILTVGGNCFQNAKAPSVLDGVVAIWLLPIGKQVLVNSKTYLRFEGVIYQLFDAIPQELTKKSRWQVAYMSSGLGDDVPPW